MSFALTPNNPNENLIKYLNHPDIKSIKFVKDHFEKDGIIKRGIHNTLKRMYYPHYQITKKKRHRKTKLQRKGSTKAKGEAIDKYIFNIIKNPKKKYSVRNSSVKALVSYWEDALEHTLQAAQVPVYIKSLNCCTQADVITQDKEGGLFLWEVKSGFNNRKAQGTLHGLNNVPNNEKNHWQLQLHYTTQGCKDYNLPIKAHQVVNVYEEGGNITVKRKKSPTWTKQLIKKKKK